MDGGRVPVALITGFLGSGKTTLLRRLAARYRGRRVTWIVNEFGALDIDGAVLRAEGMEIVPIPGGSLFCRCLATQFHRILGAVADAASAGQLDGVIIEASGISRPSGMERMLSEFSLDSQLSVASTTCVVDPARFSLVRKTLPCVTEQLECSDVVLVNRADLADEPLLAAVEAEIGRLTPAPILRCVQCAVDLDVLQWRDRRPMAGGWAEEPDPAFVRSVVETEEPQDAKRLCAELTAIAHTLYRCKGVLRTPTGESQWTLIDGGPGTPTLTPFVGCKPARCGLVLIARQGMEGPAQNLARSLGQGLFRAQ